MHQERRLISFRVTRKPSIASAYFSKGKDRPQGELESATNSLRGTLKSLQVRLHVSSS